MTVLMDKIEDDADQEVMEKKSEFMEKIKELKKINLNLRGELGSFKMKAKALVSFLLIKLRYILFK